MPMHNEKDNANHNDFISLSENLKPCSIPGQAARKGKSRKDDDDDDDEAVAAAADDDDDRNVDGRDDSDESPQ